MNAFAEFNALKTTIRTKIGKNVTLSVVAGQFRVNDVQKVSGKYVTTALTGLQSYDQCVAFARALAA